MRTTIYEDLTTSGVETDHHESDLYAVDCPETWRLLKRHGLDERTGIESVKRFKSHSNWGTPEAAHKPT